MLVNQPIEKFTELIVKYTWFKQDNAMGNHYYFSDNTPGTALEVDGKNLNLTMIHKLYGEQRKSMYTTETREDGFYLTFGSKTYKVISMSENNETNTAEMKLSLPNDRNLPLYDTYWGYVGKFDERIFK